MKLIRSLGFAALIGGYLLKHLHLTGGSPLLFIGFVLVALGSLIPLVVDWPAAAVGDVIKPLLAVLLYGTGLMFYFEIPGGFFLFSMVFMLVMAFLLSDRTRHELQHIQDIRALPLLLAALLVVLSGLAFTLMEWPTAEIQLSLGVFCVVVWMLLNVRKRG
ncbi:MAG: hypothetical protein KF905_04165 [Flavobacteriales bacterium]|nr:hypothetical protein [Flavobacteriales bacterium]